MNSYDVVEKAIGRTIESCVDAKPSSETILVPFDSLERSVNVWVPSFEVYKEIALQVINIYRRPQTFFPPAHELWPYVDVYSALHLASFLEAGERAAIIGVDRQQKSGLLGEGETVYDLMKESILFGDGAQVLDPFIPLSGNTIDLAKGRQYYFDMFTLDLPSFNELSRQFSVGTSNSYGWDIPEYKIVWAACVQEAFEIRPLLRANLLRLIPGGHFGYKGFVNLKNSTELRDAVFGSIRKVMQETRESRDESLAHSVLRSAQAIIDSSAFTHAAPFYFSKGQLEHAQSLFSAGLDSALPLTSQKTVSANLSSKIRIDVSTISNHDLISIRRNDDLFGMWRELRRELSRSCLNLSNKGDVMDAKNHLASEWRAKLDSTVKNDLVLSKQFRNGSLIYGALGAVVAGGGAALTGGLSASIIAAIAAGGALTGAGQSAEAWVRARLAKDMKQSASLAFERHLLAVERATVK